MPDELCYPNRDEIFFSDFLAHFGVFKDLQLNYDYDLLIKFEYYESYLNFDDYFENSFFEEISSNITKNGSDLRNVFF